ncbi:MAG TPA: CBS domain-containing protein [Acidiferrobacterales bacterium]|jgi:CBS domain-containing protein
MKKVPQVMSAMTPFPYSIDVDELVTKAREMMAAHDIRHLPVKDRGELVGVITDRDIKLTLGPSLGIPSGHKLKVRDVAVFEAYVVDIGERLDSVLLHMARHHVGSALVVKDGRLAGIFTTSDACKSYGEHLRGHFPVSSGDGGGDAA